jgi:hypothetical protein
MADTRRRWIDDVSDEYDSSSEETETQPCSVSPMRRESFSAKEVPVDLATDCLSKQLELTLPPYHLLLIGIPYKANNAKKLGKLLLAEGWEQRVHIKMFYNGNAFAGKALVTTESRENAQEIIKLHGRPVGTRTVSVEVFREIERGERRTNQRQTVGSEAASQEEEKGEAGASAGSRCRGPASRGRALHFRARK